MALPDSFERPGDLALPFLDARGQLLVDLSACHPLAPGRAREPAACLFAVADRELHKLTKYEAKSQAAGYLFSPLGFNLWGAFGPLGHALLKRMIRHLVGDSQGWIRSHRSALVWNRVSCTLMRFVAKQLTPALDVAPVFHLPPGLFLDPTVAAFAGPSTISSLSSVLPSSFFRSDAMIVDDGASSDNPLGPSVDASIAHSAPSSQGRIEPLFAWKSCSSIGEVQPQPQPRSSSISGKKTQKPENTRATAFLKALFQSNIDFDRQPSEPRGSHRSLYPSGHGGGRKVYYLRMCGFEPHRASFLTLIF